jgi:nicotinic acid mononucleotide adenylyltransferase
VVSRPGHPIDALRSRLPALAGRMRGADDPVTPAGDTPSIFLLQAATPEVSSTVVRDRLRRSESIAGLVPPLVETHILQHRLYLASGPATVDKSAD